MRITVDIDEKRLLGIQKATGIQKKSPAIQHALKCYVDHMARKDFILKVLEGRTDYKLSNEEVEKLGIYDID